MPVPVHSVAALSLLTVASLTGQGERTPEAFQVAMGLQQRGLHEEAARHFGEFVQKQTGHALVPEAHYRLAISQIELDKKSAAEKSLQQALQFGGTGFRLRPECRYRLGNLLEARGEHKQAAEQFSALGAEIPAKHYLMAAARFAEGESRRELGDDKAAEAAFQAAVDAAEGEGASFRFPALYQLGFAQMRQQQLNDAASTFATAASASPDEAAKCECLYLSGDLLLRLSKWDAAETAFKVAQKGKSDFADDATFGLGWVAVGRGDQAAARRSFQAVLDKYADSPLAPRARLELGRSYYRDQKHAEAARELQPLLGPDVPAPVRQQAQELVGLCALATGAGDAALKSLEKALAEASEQDRPRLSFALGEAYANLQKWSEALKAYDAVPSTAPAELRGDALYGACFALHSLGRHEESSSRAAAVRALTPPHRLSKQAAFAMAENAFALQKYEAAEREYAALAEVPEHKEKATWKLCWCRYLRGDKAAAAKQFAAVATQTGSPFAEEALAMQALALLEAGDGDAALGVADQYLARYKQGRCLDRTERVAARVLRQKGNLAAAQKRLERAATAASASGGAAAANADLVEQAELAYLQGDFKAADAVFEKLVSRTDASGARAAAGRAWCAFELGDDEACTQRLELAKSHAAAESELAGLLELESALHHRRKAWPQAIAVEQAFLQKFATHKKAPAMRYSLGVAQARNGDHKAARATLAALAKDGTYERNDRVHYELGWACRRDNDEAAALAAFAKVAAESADPELAGEANLHLGVAALDKKDLAAARPVLGKVQGSHRGRALYRLGFAEFEAAGTDVQKLATARDLFAEIAAPAVAVLAGEALAGEALYFGAECCHRLSDPRGAVQRLKQLLQADSKHARADRARLLLGECAVTTGEGDLAATTLEEFLRGKDREPGDQARAQLWLGRARMLRNEHDKAEASLQKVTELSDGPLAAEAQFRIGENRVARGDLTGAADAFVKLPILYGHAEWVRRGLLQAGLVYEKLKQPEKAERFFRELVEKHTPSDEATTAKQHLGDR